MESQKQKEIDREFVSHREMRIHTLLMVGTFIFAIALLYADTRYKDDFMNTGKRFTYCDGQALAASIWGTPIEDECANEKTPFRTYVAESLKQHRTLLGE